MKEQLIKELREIFDPVNEITNDQLIYSLACGAYDYICLEGLIVRNGFTIRNSWVMILTESPRR